MARNNAGKPTASSVARQPKCCISQAPPTKAMSEPALAPMVNTLIAPERRSGGYRSAIMDMEAGPPPASLTAAPARVAISQPAPGASAPRAAKAPPMPRHQATRPRRSWRSA